MKLTREEREKLDKMPIKDRVERLEEWMSNLESRMRREKIDKINEEYDNKSMTIIIIAMLLIWAAIWVLITKLCI